MVQILGSTPVRQNSSHRLSMSPEKGEFGSSSDFLMPNQPRPHLHDRHQIAHEFTGCNIIFPKPIDETRVVNWLEQLPASVMRAKALLNLTSDTERRYLYERVGRDVSPNPIPVRSIDTIPCSGLFIGSDLQPVEILKLTRELLHPDCHFPTP